MLRNVDLCAGLLIVALAGSACGSSNKNVEVSDEPPKWQTEPHELRIALVKHYIEDDDPKRALELISALRRERVDDPALDLYQGLALQAEQVFSEAERLLSMAGNRMPEDPRPSEALCILYADKQLVEQAIDACKRATELDAGGAAAWNNYGFLLLANDQPVEAQRALERAVQNDSTEPRYLNNLALAQATNGHTKDAVRTFSSTSSRADAFYNVGAARERVDDIEDAMVYYERALRVDEQHDQAREALAKLRAPQESQDP